VSTAEPRAAGTAHRCASDGALEDRPGTRGQRRKPAAERGRRPLAEGLDLDADGGERRPVERIRCGAGAGEGHPEGLCRRGILIVQQPEQQVIGAEPAIAATARFLGWSAGPRSGTSR
jgi:hypothetical protein